MIPEMEHPPPLLVDRATGARMLGVCERTLWSMTKPRGPIPAIRIITPGSFAGRGVIRYAVEDLKAFVRDAAAASREAS